MPGTIILKIDGKEVKIRWNEAREPTPEDVAYIENDWRQRQRGTKAFAGASATAKVTPPKKQPKQAKPQPGASPFSSPSAFLENLKGGAAIAAGQAAEDIGRAESALKRGGIQGVVPSKAIGQMLSGGDPTMARILKSAAETWEPTQMLGLAKTIAGEVSKKLATGEVSPEVSKIGSDFKKNPVGTVALMLAGVDEDMQRRIVAGDPEAFEQLVGNIIGGMSQVGAEAGVGALMAGRRALSGAAKGAKAVKGAVPDAPTIRGEVPLKSSVPETLSAKPTSVLDEVLPPAKPQPKPTVEQMPPPVAMDSPIKGSVGEAPRMETGVPVEMDAYHGTNAEFTDFDFSKTGRRTKAGSAREGVFFTDSEDIAKGYASMGNHADVEAMLERVERLERIAQRSGKNSDWDAHARAYEEYESAAFGDKSEAQIIRRRIWMQNPMVIDGGGKAFSEAQGLRWIKEAKKLGHDGIIIRDVADSVDTPFSATDVRPARERSNVIVAFGPDNITTPTAPTSARYGPSYGTPQPGQGGRTGYPMRSALDEVLEPQNTPANAPARAVETPETAGAVVEPHVWKQGAKPWIWAPREDVAIDTRFTLEPLLRRTGVFGETSASQAVNPATNWGGATLGDILVDPAWRAEFPEQLGLRIKPMKPEEMPPNVRARLVQFGPLDDDIIEVRADLLKSDPNAVIEAVLHEAAHAKRKAMGRDLDQSLPYNEQAHELSARRYTKHLLENVGSDVGTNKAKPLGVGKLQDGVHSGGDLGVRAQADTSGVRGVGEPGVRRDNPAPQEVRQSNPLEPPAQTVTPTSPTSARQADINADREALGKAGFSTDDVRKWSELEAKANPNAVPREGEGYKTGAWTDQETVNATAKLRELKAQIEELRASKADPETLVTLEDEFDNLTEAMYRSGTEQGRALASRRYTLDVDMSVDGLRARYKARAKKNGTPVDAKRLQELEQIAADYKRLQEQIDSGELVKARKRSKGPAKTKEELAEELSKMWDEFSAKDKNTLDEFFEDGVSSASNFTTERVAMIGKMAVKAVELGVATIDELVEAVAKQFRDRGLDAPDRATILNAWRTEREAGRRSVSEEVKAARAQRAKLEVEINAELDAPKKAEANAKKAAEAAENRARKAAERQQQAEANQKARAEEKARARAQREAADAEAKALREEQERILSERKAWDKRNRDRQREMERLNTRIAELEQSIEAGTGEGPKPRKQTLQDPELARAQNRMETLRKRARAIYKDQQPKPTWQRVTDATTSGRLLNPVNRGLDFLSGVSNIVNRAFIDGNVAALTSALSKDARVGSLLDPAKIKRVVDLMKSSDLARQLLDEGMYGNRGLGGKLAGMTDIPAKMFLYHVALDDMAFNIARRQLGKAPKEQITRRALDLLQNPTDEMVETATAEMLAQTYNTQTFVGAHLASTKSAMYKAMRGNDPGPIRSVAAGFTTGMFDMLTKFSNVITNVAKDRGARTLNIGGIPVSSAYAVGEFATKKIAKKAMATAERRHLQMLFAKGATGSAFTYLGYNYARELGIVPQISRNTNEEGKDPGNPYVDGGGVAGVLEQVGGFLTPFLWGAQLREIDEANLTDKQKSALKRQTLVEMAMSTPATGGMEKIVGLWQGRTSPWTFGGGVMASQMPGPVKMVGERLDAYNSSDPNDAFILRLFSKATERRTKVKESDGMTEAEAALWEFIRPIMRNTPMLREKLPEQDKKNVNR